MAGKYIEEIGLKFTGDFSQLTEQAKTAIGALDVKAPRAGAQAEAIGRQAKTYAENNLGISTNSKLYRQLNSALTTAIENVKSQAAAYQLAAKEKAKADREAYQAQRNATREKAKEESRKRTEESQSLSTQRSIKDFVDRETKARQADARGARALAGSSPYITANTAAVTNNALLQAEKLKALNNPKTNRAVVSEDTANNQLEASLNAERSASKLFVESTVALAEEQKRLAAAIAREKAASTDYLEAVAEDAVSAKALANAERAETQAHKDFTDTVRQSIALEKERQRIEAEAATSQENVNNDARSRVARRRGELQTASEVNRLTTDQDREAEVTARVIQARERLAQDLAVQVQRTSEDIKAEAQLIVLKRKQATELAEQVAQLSGKGDASVFQRLLFRTSSGGGGFGGGGGLKTAADEPSFGNFLTNHAIRTASYAIPGIAIGFGFEEIRKSVDEAEKAQRSLALLQAQFQNLGQGNQFQGFSSAISSLSSSTGIAVDEVTQLGLAMKGVYGNTQDAQAALTNVTKAAFAFGLTAQEAGRDTNAITQNFPQLSGLSGGAATKTVANQAAFISAQFGIPAGQLLSGTADLAPDAAQLGLKPQQTFALVAGTAARSGTPVDEVSQTLSRILPQFTATLPDLVRYYQAVPSLRGTSGKFTSDVFSGNISDAFLQFLSDFKKIPKGLQDSIAEELGGARYAPQLIAASQNGDKINQFASAAVPADAADNAFKKTQNTLQGQLDDVRNQFVNVGVGILNSGIGNTLQKVADAFGVLGRAFADLNSATGGGLADDIGLVVSALVALKVAGAVKDFVSPLTGVLRTLGSSAATAAPKVAEQSAANATVGETATTTTADLEAETVANANLGRSAVVTSAEEGAGGFAGVAGKAGLVGLAGVTAFQGTSALLNSNKKESEHVITNALNEIPGVHLYGKDDGGGGKTTSLTKNTQDFVNNFGKTHKSQIDKLQKIATPEQQAEIAFAEYDNDNVALLKLYNQLSSTAKGKDALYTKAQQSAQAAAVATHAAVAAKSQEATNAQNLASAESSSLNDSQALLSYYQAGKGSFDAYIKSLNDEINTLGGLAAQGGTDQKQILEQLAQKRAEKVQALDQQAQLEEQGLTAALQPGTAATSQATLKALGDLLNKQGNPADQISTATQYLQQIFTGLSAAASEAETGAGAITAATQTVQLPQNVIDALKKAGVNISSVTGKLTNKQTFQDLNQDVQANAALAQAAAKEDPLGQALAAKAAADQQVASVLKAGESKNSNDYKNALAQQQTTAQQVIDQQRAVTSAQDSLLQAQDTAAGDVVQAAKDAQQVAQDAIDAAHGDAQRLAAEAQKVSADRAFITAINEVASAQAALLTAQAQATGDPRQIIAAAQNAAAVDLQNANRIAAADRALGKNPNNDQAYIQALTQYYNDRAAAANTIAQQTISTNETLLFLGKETATAAIANLEAALPKVKGDIAATNQILTEIRQIQNSAGSNLNFNIPTTLLAQPTLYQAERLNQSGTGPYTRGNGNQVQVNITIANPSQTPGAVNKIVQAIGGPSVGSISGATL